MFSSNRKIYSCSVVVVVEVVVVVAPLEVSVLVLVAVFVSPAVFSAPPHADKQRATIAVHSMVLSIRINSIGKGSAGQAQNKRIRRRRMSALQHRR